MKLLIPLFLCNIASVAADTGKTEPPRPSPRPTEHDKFNRDGTEAPDFIVVPTDAPVWPPTPPPIGNPPPTRSPTTRSPTRRPTQRPTPFPTLPPILPPVAVPVAPKLLFGAGDRDDGPGDAIAFPPTPEPTRNPTSNPTPAPTPNPTPAPTTQPTTPPPTAPLNIFELAAGSSACPHDTLLSNLVTTQGVLTTVISNFPVTIFGPTNSAFASGVADGLDQGTLSNVLAGHVVPGVYTAADIIASECIELQSLAGEPLRIRYANGQIEINDAVVICDDLVGPGGNFLGIDSVILPGSFRPCRNGYVEQAFLYGVPDPFVMPRSSMYDAAWRRGGYGLLLSSITRSTGVMDTIARHYPVTIFGPNDDAYNANFDMLVMTDMSDIGRVFSAHVVKGIYTLRDFAEAGCTELTTVGGTRIRVLVENQMVKVNDALLTTPDMIGNGADGIIQGIDKMLMEGSFTPCPTSPTNTILGNSDNQGDIMFGAGDSQRDDTSASSPPIPLNPPTPEETEAVLPPTLDENEEDKDNDKDEDKKSKSKSKKSKKKDDDDRRLRGNREV